jgi:hypothetical protein
VDREYFKPTQRGFEAELARRLEFIKERLSKTSEKMKIDAEN